VPRGEVGHGLYVTSSVSVGRTSDSGFDCQVHFLGRTDQQEFLCTFFFYNCFKIYIFFLDFCLKICFFFNII
jgi:hypothetical protein